MSAATEGGVPAIRAGLGERAAWLGPWARLPVGMSVERRGIAAGLGALFVGIGLTALWGTGAAIQQDQVVNLPHVIGALALAGGFAWTRRVVRHDRRQTGELARSSAAMRSIVENAPLILWAVDRHGRFLVREGKALRNLGATPGGWVGRSVREFCVSVYPENPELLQFVELALAGEETHASIQVRGRTEEVHFGPIRDARGAISGAVATAIDVTEQRAFEADLAHRALYDGLTDLPNRALMAERIRQEITASASDRTFAIIVANLDTFQDINDSFGHETGDQVLRDVAERLRTHVGPADTVARLGGDEFAILLPNADDRRAVNVATRVLRGLGRTRLGDGTAIDPCASLGISTYPAHGGDPLSLLRRADIAMHVAKRTRRTYTMYSADLDDSDPDAMALVSGLRDAIRRDGLSLAFQPDVRMSDGVLLRVEALARWTHPARGPIPPGRFIRLAERGGLMGPLTRRVLRDALTRAAEWRTDGIDAVVAVNLSAHNLADPALQSIIVAALERAGLPAGALALEVTESVLMSDIDRVVPQLRSLRGLGIDLAIDDFGTGYSSLSYLSRLPVDRLKIDRSFVMRLGADAGARAIARATVALGHDLGLHVVAEGVETRAEWDLLAELGCDSVQGYYVSRPLDPAAFARWSRERPDRIAAGDRGVA